MPPHKTATFHPFPRLPIELRLQIWEQAIPQERMLRISLKPHSGRRYDLACDEPRYLHKNHLQKPISGERYRAEVHAAAAAADGGGECSSSNGRCIHSRFLRVNSEARRAAMCFYRVHIPVYMTGPRRTVRSTLYLNPEHDLLHIWAAAPVKDTLLDFLWDVKAYDPKNVGLRKLGVDLDGFCANDLQYLRKCDLLLIRHRNILIETLSQLSEVWFINLQAASRSTKPQKRTRTSKLGCVDSGATWGDVLAIQRLGADCRSGVDKELEKVFMGDVDPREILFRWRRLLRTWGIQYESSQVDYRLLVGNIPLSTSEHQASRLAETTHAMELLTLQQDKAKNDMAKTPTAQVESSAQTNMARGFWLFPLEAIGELGEGERLADMDFLPHRILDMRNHRPELVLSTG